MHIENKVNQKKVKEEFDGLKKVFQNLGVEILEIEQVRGLPDMVFSANFGFPKGNLFILSNFKYPQRKKEADHAKNFFEKLGFSVNSLPPNIAFEGQGDLLTVNGDCFFGWGKRSDQEAKDYLSRLLKLDLIELKLTNPYYYHLDTCFAPLDEKTVVINPESFDDESLAKIYKYFPNVICTSFEDNKQIACNLVVVGKTVVIGAGITGKLKTDFEKYGFTPTEVPMHEFRKSGGSVKCLTLEFHY